MEEVCDVAREHGLLIVCDEIYRDLAYEPERAAQPGQLLPEQHLRHQRPEQEHGPRRLADRILPAAATGRSAPRRPPR